MKTKLTQSLPLLGTFLALIIGGAVLFKLTPADAVLDATETSVPPVNATTAVETTDAEPIETDEEIVEEVELISATTDENGEPLVDSETGEPVDPRVVMVPEVTTTEYAKTVTGIYAEANENVTLADHYLNDVYVAGGNITITGTVEGDLFAAGETIIVDGTVMGSVRAAGSSIQINGAVGRNVMAAGADVQISQRSHIGADVMLFSDNAKIEAMVMGNVTGAMSELFIDSIVEGEVNLHGVEDLTFGPNSYVMGPVSYTSNKPASIDEEAALLGQVNYTQQEIDKETAAVAGTVAMLVINIILTVLMWIGLLIFGIVLIKLAPKFSASVITTMRANGGRSLGYGILTLVLMPLALLLIAVTVIGLPLAFAGTLVYILMLMAAHVFVGLALGKMMLKNSKGMVWPFILGFSLFFLITEMIGWLGLAGMLVNCVISTLAAAWALGAIMTACKQR